MISDEISVLVDKYIDGDITAEEARKLAGIIRRKDEIAREVMKELEIAGMSGQVLSSVSADDVARSFNERVNAEAGDTGLADKISRKIGAPPARRERISPWRVVLPLAASIAVLVGAWIIVRQNFAVRMAPGKTTPVSAYAMATVREIKWSAMLKDASGEHPASSGSVVRAGSSLVTPQLQKATMILNDGSEIELGWNTTVKLDGAAGRVMVALSNGVLNCRVAKQDKDATFKCTTRDGEFIVAGTEFRLEQDQAVSRLQMKEGIMDVKRFADGRKARVHDGQFLYVNPGTELIAWTSFSTNRPGKVLFRDSFAGKFAPEWKTENLEWKFSECKEAGAKTPVVTLISTNGTNFSSLTLSLPPPAAGKLYVAEWDMSLDKIPRSDIKIIIAQSLYAPEDASAVAVTQLYYGKPEMQKLHHYRHESEQRNVDGRLVSRNLMIRNETPIVLVTCEGKPGSVFHLSMRNCIIRLANFKVTEQTSN